MSNQEKAILVGCHLSKESTERFEYSMDELAALTETAQGTSIATITQKRERLDPATYIGSGKVKEIAELEEELEADVIIINGELSPSQVRNLSSYFTSRVVDRTQLILDIFAQRAKSKEGKLQVELAQLQYILPRLAGKGIELSRLGGGIGTRGPGETKLETDRRHIRNRIKDIKRQLSTIVQHRERYRSRRKRNEVLQIALVGYTNAGKSTIFNRLTESDAYEENKLFATLDPMTRRLKLPNGLEVLLTDTVGFIQDLPTTLVAAFRSTLEEATEADLILHVIDGSHPDHDQHEKIVTGLLNELDAAHIPVLTVYNKRDLIENSFVPASIHDTIFISALEMGDIRKLNKKIETVLIDQMEYYHFFVPPENGASLSKLRSKTVLQSKQWDEEKNLFECKGYAPVAVLHNIEKELDNIR
ncbi:GTPase HflX [Pseudalkalibacillus caeni]|uniref:GTPase HflX n=1 Tax=Exobacillus caeni TaxID=2574798 RepID=A0A5R9F9U6_9BACL|nr:GTPase HflX [Pseudalkalibacillus caeni]